MANAAFSQCMSVWSLPGNVDGHVLMCRPGEDGEELVEDGGQKVDHHMTFHCMKALKWRKLKNRSHLSKPCLYVYLPSGKRVNASHSSSYYLQVFNQLPL